MNNGPARAALLRAEQLERPEATAHAEQGLDRARKLHRLARSYRGVAAA
jgi:hypothetical protein